MKLQTLCSEVEQTLCSEVEQLGSASPLERDGITFTWKKSEANSSEKEVRPEDCKDSQVHARTNAKVCSNKRVACFRRRIVNDWGSWRVSEHRGSAKRGKHIRNGNVCIIHRVKKVSELFKERVMMIRLEAS